MNMSAYKKLNILNKIEVPTLSLFSILSSPEVTILINLLSIFPELFPVHLLSGKM